MEILKSVRACFECISVVIAIDAREGERHRIHIAILNTNAHKDRAARILRNAFPEFEEFDVKFHKSWNSAYGFHGKGEGSYLWAAVGVASTARLVWIGSTHLLTEELNPRDSGFEAGPISDLLHQWETSLDQFFHKTSPDPAIDHQKVGKYTVAVQT